jgi:hypothetical protein
VETVRDTIETIRDSYRFVETSGDSVEITNEIQMTKAGAGGRGSGVSSQCSDSLIASAMLPASGAPPRLLRQASCIAVRCVEHANLDS